MCCHIYSTTPPGRRRKVRKIQMAKKPVQLDENGKRKFGMRDCLAYAAGDLGCNMSFALKSTMAIFWTQFMKLDLWYSMLLIIVQVWMLSTTR